MNQAGANLVSVVIEKVWSSMIFRSAPSGKNPFLYEAYSSLLLVTRFHQNSTSRVVTGVPSDHLASSRSLMV